MPIFKTLLNRAPQFRLTTQLFSSSCIANMGKSASKPLNKSKVFDSQSTTLNEKVDPTINMAFEAEKQTYLNMSKEEKRELYKGQVTYLQDVPTWPQYWSENKSRIPRAPGAKDDKIDGNIGKRISIWKGDITSLEIDAIVNAANESLLGGGGVDGAIHKAAGPNLKAECSRLNGCAVGQAKITGGYKLPAKYVIHTVGPRGEKPAQLSDCYNNCMNLAVENNLRTIAFPCISTGIFGYPQRKAAEIATCMVTKYVEEHPNAFDRLIFCVFLDTDLEIYEELLQKFSDVEAD